MNRTLKVIAIALTLLLVFGTGAFAAPAQSTTSAS